jgi:predicted membrane protein
MNREGDRSATKGFTPRLVLGLTIMAAGVFLALDNLGIIDSSLFFRYWPLAFVALGILKLTSSKQQSGGVFWILIGIALLAFTTGQMNFQRLWALILVFVGGSIAWRAFRPRPPRTHAASTVDLLAMLGGTKTVNSSDDFRGGQAVAVMGGCDIDLRKATIAEEEAVLDVFSFWGGVVVVVPEDWEVDNQVNAFLGGVEDKTHPVPGSKQRLVLTGTVVMGGAEVKH